MSAAEEEVVEDGAARVFLSYSRKDRERAQRIADTLRERHFGVFRDTDDILPTEEWKDRLQSLIEEADTIVFLLSPNSVHSEVCAWEVEYATSLNKRVAPIVIDDTEASDIPPLLARLNFIFCTDRDPYENAIDTLVSALNTDIDWIREHTRLAALAQRWEAAGRPGRLLLRGEDIADAERWRDGHPPEAPDVTPLQAELIAESRRAATRRQRLWIGGSLAAAATGIALAVFAYFQAIEAENQREIAEEQQELAVKERNQALIAQSNYLADIANEEVQQGDGTLAILASLEAIQDEASEDLQQRTRPFVRQAQAALTNAVLQRREVAIFSGHPDGLTHATFSPDGSRLATTDYDRGAILWDMSTGRMIAELAGHESTVRHAAFSPDGGLLITGGDDGIVRVWNGRTGEPVREIGSTRDGLSTVAFSPDGSRILSGKGEVWDVATGELVFALSQENGEFWNAYYSPDGSRIVTVETFVVERWDARTGERIGAIRSTSDNFELFDYAPDGEHYLVSVSYGSRRIGVHQAGKGGKLYEIGSPDDPGISAAVFSPDSKLIATGSQDGRARVWGVLGKRLAATMLGHTGAVNHIRFSPDSKHVVTASEDGTARVWSAHTGLELNRLTGHGKGVTGVEFSPDGQHVLTWSWDGTARLWDWRRFTETVELPASPNGTAIYQAEFIGESDNVFTAGGYHIGFGVWDLETGDLKHRLQGVVRGAASPDGQIVLTQDSYSDTRLRKPDELQSSDGIGGKWDYTSNLVMPVFSPDGTRFILTGVSNAGVFDVTTFRRVGLIFGHLDSIESVRFSQDGAVIATSSRDKTARLWHGETGDLVHEFRGHTDVVREAILTPDASRLVTVSFDQTVRVWDTATGEEIRQMKSSGGMTTADISPDGQTVVTNAFSGRLHLWDIGTGEELASFHPHEGDFNSADHVNFSPDGRFIASAWDNGATRLHDAATLEVVGVYRGHREEVWRVRFRRDGRKLVTASWDGTARVSPIWPDPAELIAHAKRIVPRCLTTLERTQLHLPPEVPAWCREMKKWPYDKAAAQ